MRGLVAAGGLAADDAGQRLHARRVGNDAVFRARFYGFTVKAGEFLAIASAKFEEAARDFIRVEHMQRAAEVVGEEVGDVDQGVDRAQAHGFQALFQPFRAFAVFHAGHGAAEHPGAGFGKFITPRHGAGTGTSYRGRSKVLQYAQAGGGEVARHAAHAQCVATVGGDCDFDHRVVHAGPHRVGHADGCVLGQFDNAVGIALQPQLPEADQHALGFHAADFTNFERNAGARHKRAGRGKHHAQAGARVWRAADHGTFHAVAHIHAAGAQAVGVGVGQGLDHLRDHKRCQRGGAVFHALHFQADGGQGGEDLLQGRVRLQPGLQP